MSKSQSKKMKLLVASLAVGSLYFMPVSQAATVAGDSVTWHDTSGTIQASASSASLKNQNGSGISVRYTSENPDNPDLTKQADAIMFNLSGVNNGKPVLFVNKNGATFYTGVTATKLTADTLTLGTNTLTPDALGKLNAIAATGGADFSKYEAAGIVPGTATDRNSSYKANPSIAIGEKAKAGDSSVTIGNGSYSHVYGVAIGSLSQATGNGAVAIGGKNNASGTSSVAIGQESLATGEKSVALGYQANTNKHANSIAIGSESRVYEDNVVSVGNVNNKRRITNVGAAVDDTDAVNYKQLKESDALDVQYDDNAKDTITLGGLDENGKPATDAVKITNVADANFAKGSTDAVNAGQLYAAGIVPGTAGTGAIAIGDGSKANDYATVLGNGSQAGSGGVAVGSGSNSANTAVAIGEKAKAVHTALAAGPDAKALGEGSVALGKGANVTGKNSIALGADTKVWNKNSVVIGYQSSTYEDNTVSVGNDKLKRKVVNVAAGEADTDAVNVKQLTDKVAGATKNAVYWDGDNKKTITGNGATLDLETTDDDMTTGINNGKAALKMFDSTIAMTSEKNSVAVGKDGILLTGKTKVDGSLNVVDGDSALGVSNGTAAMRAGDAAVFLNGVQANVNVGTNGFTVDASGTRVTGGLSVENSKITNVADGVNANDAATVGQLNSKVSESVEGVVRWDKDDNGKYTDNQIKGVIFNGNGNLEVTDIKSANYSLETVGANTQHIIHVAADDKDNTTGKAYTQIEGYNQFFEDGTVSLGNGGTKTVYVGGTDGIKFIGAGGKNNTIANLSNTEFKANETYTGGYAATQEQVQDAYKQAVSDAGVASDQKIQDALDKTVGDLDKLNTNNKGNIVDSINEVNNKVGSGVLTGDLAGKNITDGLNTVNGKIDGITNTVNKNNENMTGITYDKASDTTNIDNNVHITGGVQVDNDIKANGNIVGGKVSTSSGADLDEVDKRVGKLDRLNDEIKNNAEYKKDSSVVGAVNAEADIRRNEVARIDSNVSALSGRVDSLESRMGDVEERIDKVGAMSAAIANLRTMGFDPEAPTEIAVGVGQYKSETGLALGVFHYPNQDFMLSASISTSGDEVMGGIGATWKLGRKSAAERARISEEKAAEKAAEIKAAAAKAAKDAEVNAQREKHAQLLAQREAAHQDIHQSAEKA